MIRQQLHLFNDSALVLPVYGTTSGSPPPGTLNRAYHRRLKIYADGVFVLPAYDTVGGTPGPATGTMAPRYHRGLTVHAGAWNEAIVLPAYGVQDSTPTPTPTGQESTSSVLAGGGIQDRYWRDLEKRYERARRKARKKSKRAVEIIEELARQELALSQAVAELHQELAREHLQSAEIYVELLRLKLELAEEDDDDFMLLQ